jgi:D-alanyl-D-alanine carboxypeptidase
MRKRNVRGICAFLCTILLGCLIPAGEVQAQRALDVARERGYQLEERYQPAGSIITEINTGQILWQENAQKQWPPASMTKLMTILLAYEEIKAGNLELESTAEVNERYTDIAGRYALSNNKMQPGASYTVAELMDLIIVPSSAAATYMLADMVESDPDRFVERMNQKAQELGMVNTKYFNCVGVTNNLLQPYHPVSQPLDGDNITTPEDYAMLCTYLIKTYPDILNHTKYPQITVKEGTPYEEHFTSYQISLEGAKYGLEGTDGLKTGSSDTAGFNYSSTAKRGGTRLVEIVMGVSDWSDQTGEELRHLVGNAIMEQAFERFEYKKVLSKGVHTIDGKKVEISKDLWDCVPKGKEAPLTIKDGKVLVDLEREYLPGFQAPAVSCKQVAAVEKNEQKGLPLFLKVLLVLAAVFVILVGARISYVAYRKKQRRKRREAQRRRRARRIRELEEK